jgi:hypothetical protein
MCLELILDRQKIVGKFLPDEAGFNVLSVILAGSARSDVIAPRRLCI